MDTPEQSRERWEAPRDIFPKENHRGGGKWEAWGRAVLSFILGVVSAAFFAGGKSRNIDELLTFQGEAKAEFKTLSQRIDHMDTSGTSRSHWVDDQQSQQIAANSASIADLRAKAEQRSETINVMQGKLERYESELKDLKERR